MGDDIDEITKQIGAKQNEVITLEKNLKKVKELQKQKRTVNPFSIKGFTVSFIIPTPQLQVAYS